jgi:TonB family protein
LKTSNLHKYIIEDVNSFLKRKNEVMKPINRVLFAFSLVLSFGLFFISEQTQAQNKSTEIVGTQTVRFPDKKGVVILPDGRVVYDHPDQPPTYPADLEGYFASQVKFPPGLLKKSFAAKTVVRFIVNTNGETSDVQIMQSSGEPDLDREASRVVQQMKGWRPARQDGQPVPAFCSLPVSFKNDKPDKQDRIDPSSDKKNKSINQQ